MNARASHQRSCPICGGAFAQIAPEGNTCGSCGRTFKGSQLSGSQSDALEPRSLRPLASEPSERERRFPIPKWTSFPEPPEAVKAVLHVLSSLFHEGNERNEITDLEDALVDYLYELEFFESADGELHMPYGFVRTHGVGVILAALKFVLYQRNISNPGGFLRTVIEGGDTGRLHNFIRKRLRGYVERFDRWLCPEERALVQEWADYTGFGSGAAKALESLPTPSSSSPSKKPKPLTLRNAPGCGCHDSYNESYFKVHSDLFDREFSERKEASS